MEFGAGGGDVDYVKYLEGSLNHPNIVKSIMDKKPEIEKEISKLLKKALS